MCAVDFVGLTHDGWTSLKFLIQKAMTPLHVATLTKTVTCSVRFWILEKFVEVILRRI